VVLQQDKGELQEYLTNLGQGADESGAEATTDTETHGTVISAQPVQGGDGDSAGRRPQSLGKDLAHPLPGVARV
jgi:hypothetical protein